MCIPDYTLTRRQSLALAASALFVTQFKTKRTRSVDVGGGLKVFPRSSWGADLPPKGPLEPEPDVRFLLVHHTAGNTEYSQSSVANQIRGAYNFHTGPEKKWNDVCYNFFVDRYGGVWEGRAGSLDGPVMADATGGSQGFAQLVCLIGNFQENQPTPEMIASLEKTLAWLATRHGIDPSPGQLVEFVSRGSNRWPSGALVKARTISGHRDMSKTACPGDFVYPLLESVIPENVAALTSPHNASTPTTSSTVIDSATTEVPSEPLPEESTPTTDPASSSTTTPISTPAIEVDDSADTKGGDNRVADVAATIAITAAAVGVASTAAIAMKRRQP